MHDCPCWGQPVYSADYPNEPHESCITDKHAEHSEQCMMCRWARLSQDVRENSCEIGKKLIDDA
jgi:hypothetical protein